MDNEKNMFDALIQHQVYAFRASSKVVNELQDEFVKSSNSISSRLRDLLDDLTQAEKSSLIGGKYTTDSLKEIKSLFDELYSTVAISLPETFLVSATALAVYESSYITKLYGSKDIGLNGDKIAKKALKTPITGGLLFDDIWKDLADSTRNKAIYAVRQGISNGLTTAQIVQEVKGKRVKQLDGSYVYSGGIVEQTKNNIDAEVRTIRTHLSNVAMVETFEALGYEYVKDVAVLDGRTSSICRYRDGKIQKSTEVKERPPYHRRCRTVQVGCDKDGFIDGKRPFVADTRSVKNIPKDERAGKIGQIDANTTYPEWFKRQDSGFQREVLGKTKYELYKKGGFTFDKFIDPLGKQYTIAELKALDAATFKRLGL